MSHTSDSLFADELSPPQHDLCFFFNDTATTEIYTLSLHDALPIPNASDAAAIPAILRGREQWRRVRRVRFEIGSTRLNSSHLVISYAVFCLKKKKKKKKLNITKKKKKKKKKHNNKT